MTAQVQQHAAVARAAAQRRGTRRAAGSGGSGGAGGEDDRLDRQGRGTLAAQLVVAGLAAAAFAQGGYHPAGRLPLLVGIPVAALLVATARGLDAALLTSDARILKYAATLSTLRVHDAGR